MGDQQLFCALALGRGFRTGSSGGIGRSGRNGKNAGTRRLTLIEYFF